MNNQNKNSNTPVNPTSPNPIEVYFSVDVEADGRIPGPFSMSSFGIVATSFLDEQDNFTRLDLDDDKNCYYAELKPISDNFMEEVSAVAGLDRAMLLRDGLEPSKAMTDAYHFVKGVTGDLGAKRAVFVGYPLGFDWTFMYWYFMNFSEEGSPFGFSSHVDIKTLYAFKANKPISKVNKRNIPKHLHSTRKHTHNALDDAREQGDLFNNITEWCP